MKDINQRPIILVSNSSWYLFHYRKLLIQKIKKEKHHLIALAPYDSTSKDLSNFLVHIPWRMSRKKNQNLYSFFISFLRMLLLIRAIKPKLIHSHTLQANLISSIVSSFFGINCVLSFAGIGRFSKSKGLSKLFFIYIFKIIYFFSNYQRGTRFKYFFNPNRSIFIFQNQNDIDFLGKELNNLKTFNFSLIPGSGIPYSYISKSNIFSKNSRWKKSPHNYLNRKALLCKVTFIYCARLLKSKGILLFLKLAKLNPNSKFLIFGSIDSSSKDSLTKNDILIFTRKCKNVSFMDNKLNPLLYKKINYPVLIVPSIYGEGFPRGIIEANTLSIPVISSKEAAEKIPIKNICYVNKKNNISGYEKCINKLTNEYFSGKLYLKLENAKEKAIMNFSEKKIVEKTIEIYEYLNKKRNESYLLNKDRDKLDNWIAQ